MSRHRNKGSDPVLKKQGEKFARLQAEQELPTVEGREVTVWRDRHGRFAKLPANGKRPYGWKKTVEVRYYDAQGRSVRRPDNLAEVLSYRKLEFREQGSKVWKSLEKTDFRKPLFARLIEYTGDGKTVLAKLNDGKAKRWKKTELKEERKQLIRPVSTDRKIEIVLEGKTVKDALSRYNWEVAEWGKKVFVNGQCNYNYMTPAGIARRTKFAFDFVEDWVHGYNLGQWDYSGKKPKFIKGAATYGSILRDDLGREIRKGFANRQQRFTTLDVLDEMLEAGIIDDDLMDTMQDRTQVENVVLYLLLTVREK